MNRQYLSSWVMEARSARTGGAMKRASHHHQRGLAGSSGVLISASMRESVGASVGSASLPGLRVETGGTFRLASLPGPQVRGTGGTLRSSFAGPKVETGGTLVVSWVSMYCSRNIWLTAWSSAWRTRGPGFQARRSPMEWRAVRYLSP